MNRLSNMLVTIVLVLVACDSSNLATVDDKSPDLMVKNTINGVVVANKVSGAQVEVYAVEDNGDVGQLLNFSEVFTNGDGSYTIEIPEYSGQVLVISKGGSYKDEATGLAIDLTDTELRAVTEIAEVTEDSPAEKNIAVITPLTELSTQLMDGDLSPENSNKVNTEIAKIFFGTADPDLITKTSPIVQQDDTPTDDSQPDEKVKSDTLNYNLILSGLSSLAKGNNPVEALTKIKEEIVVNNGDLSNDFKEDLVEGAIAVLDSQGIEVELENNTVLNITEEFKEEIKVKVASDFFARKLPQLIEVRSGNINAFELLISDQLRNIFDFKFFIVKNNGTQEETTAVQIPTDTLVDAALLVELTDKETGTSKTEYVNFTIVETVKEFTYNIANVNNNGLIPLQINQTSGDSVETVLNNMSKRTIEIVEINDQTFLRVLQDGIAVIAVRSQADSDVTFANFSFNVIEDRNDILDIEWSFDGDRLISDYRSNENFSLFYEVNDVEFGELDIVDRGPLSLDDTLSFYYVNRDGIRLTNKVSSELFSIVQRTSLKDFNQLEKDTLSVDSFASVLDLSFQEANVAYYASLLQESEAFASFTDLQTFIDTADRSMSSFKVVQQASVSGDDSLIETETFNSIINLIFNSNSLPHYRNEIVLTETLSSIDALQKLIISVDNSLNAMAKVKGYALGSISEITVADFDAILHLTHFDPAQLPHYQTALRIKGDVGDITALDRLLLNVNQEQALLASANGMIASTPLTLSDWFDGQLISAFIEENLEVYNSEILERQLLDNFAAIVVLVVEVNDSVSAINKMNQAAIASDTTELTLNDFEKVLHLENFDVENFDAYLQAIASQEAVKDIAALNRILLSMNDTQGLLSIINEIDEESPLGLVQWQANGAVENVRDGDYLAAYNFEAIKRKPLSSMDDIQRLVNEVNVSVTALIKIQNAVGNINATIDSEDFNVILHLEHFDALNEAAYVTAIINGDEIISVADLSQVLNRTNQEVGLLDAVNDSRDKLSLPQWQADELLIDVMNTPAHLDGYHQERLTRQPFTSVVLVQDLINDVNVSIESLNKISAAAGNNDSRDIVEDDFTAILDLLHYESANYTAYLNAIAATSSIPNLDALHDVLLLTNHQQALLKVVNDANEGLSEAQWQENGLVASRFIPQNRAQYNDELSLRQPFTTFASIEALLDEVNASVTAFTKIQAAVGGDTSALSAAEFNDILHLENYSPANFSEYLSAIEKASTLEDLAALNIVIVSVNSEQDFLTLLNNITPQSPISLAQWQTDGLVSSTQALAYLDGYNDEILNRQPLSSIEEAQALINEVNANVDAFTVLDGVTNTGNADAVTIEIFYAILGLEPTLVVPANLAAYQEELTQLTSSDVDELSDISAFLTKVNESETALGEVNLLLSQHRAFDLDDVLLLKILALEDSYDVAHQSAYQIAFANISTESLPVTALELDATIQDTNTRQTALANLRLAITNVSNIGDAIGQVRGYLNALMTRSDMEYQGAFNRLLMGLSERGSTFNTTYFDSIDGRLVAINPADNTPFYVVKDDIKPIPVSVIYSTAAGRNVFVINGEERPVLALDAGNTYLFDQSDASNANHPIAFTSTAGDFTMQSFGVPGAQGAFTEVTIGEGNTDLSYFCTLHGAGMGNLVDLGNPALTLAVTSALTELGVTAVIDTQSGITVNGQLVAFTQHRDGVVYDYLTDRGFVEPATETNRSLDLLTTQNLDHVMQIISVHINAIDNINAALASDVSEVTLDDLNRLVTVSNAQSSSLSGYHQAILDNNLVSINDGSELQNIINRVNGDDALIALVNNAIINNTTLSQEAWQTGGILTDVRADGYLDAYQYYLTNHPVFTNAVDIQTFINDVNNSVDSLKIISAAADSETAETVTLAALQNVIGLTNIDGDNLNAYRGEIVKLTSATLGDVTVLQTVVDRTNASETAFEVVMVAALTNNASEVSEAVLSSIIDLTFSVTNLSAYQSAIAQTSNIATLSDLQTLINNVDASVNAFALVQNAALNNNASNITANVLADIIDLNFDDTHIQGYQSQIATSVSIDSITVLQTIISEVDESESAFEQVQAAASNNDASVVTATLLGRILNLTSDSSHIAEYKNHIEAQSSIDSVVNLQLVLSEVDDSLAAFELVQTAASFNNGTTVTDAVLSDILNLAHVSANVLSYQTAIAEQSIISTVSDLQTLINSVDASLLAFAEVQQAASDSDAATLTFDTLTAIRSLTFDSVNFADYQSAIAAETAIADVVALQALIDSVDASLVAFAAVQAAATNNDGSTVTTDTLSAIRGLTFDSANFGDYQSAIAAEASIADVAALQGLIDSVDASLAAFAAVQLAATNNDASTVTTDTLIAIRGLTTNGDNIVDYQGAIAAEASIADVVALQALIDNVDTSTSALSDVQAAATNNDASAVTTDTLSAIRGLTFDSANITDYQGAIAAEASIANVAALQALIDSVDASLVAFANVQAAATNNDASTVTIDTLSAIRGLTF
ncbi:MAG: hypothetical protein HWE31_02755, partial [Vibrio campbellii]|nr:hypothetical protein [Vibrio campbellii]